MRNFVPSAACSAWCGCAVAACHPSSPSCPDANRSSIPIVAYQRRNVPFKPSRVSMSFLARGPIRGLRRNESAVACGCEGGFTWERDRSLLVRWVGPSRYLSALTDLSDLSDLSALSALYSLSSCRAYGPILFFGSFPNPPARQFVVYFSHLLHGDGRTSEAKPDYAEVVGPVRGSEGGSGPTTIPFHSVGINLDSPHRYPSPRTLALTLSLALYQVHASMTTDVPSQDQGACACMTFAQVANESSR